MAAKTRGDLDGLFDDLPDPEPAGAPPAGPAAFPVRRRRGSRPFLLLVLVIAILYAAWHTIAFASIYIPWFWVAVIAAIIVFAGRSSRTRRDR